MAGLRRGLYGAEGGLPAVGLRPAYTLAGDSPGGGASNIDPFATAATTDDQWVVEGPHVMILVPDPAMLEEMSTDPDSGAPYVMWKGTAMEAARRTTPATGAA